MKNTTRAMGRANEEMRPVTIELGVLKDAEGSCLISFGDTKVICSATIDDKVPHFLKGKRQGWVTAEYGMLPRSTVTRMQRDSSKGISGRSHEIQRLIGRSLRSVVRLQELGERQIIIDCDVIQADGGTRTAAITGGFVALCHAVKGMYKSKLIKAIPITCQVAAVSCGIIKGVPMVDLDFQEDSSADVDANFVITSDGKLIEVQATAENKSFTTDQLTEMLNLAQDSISGLIKAQREALGIFD